MQLADAIWRDDLDLVHALITNNPRLIRDHVLIRTDSSWGPPMTYAANLGRNEIIRFLYDRGAGDAESAAGRAALQGVSQRNFLVNYGKGQPDEARFTRLLLDRRAHPNTRASLRQRLEEGHGGGPLREYRDVTPLGWGQEYHANIFVSRESLRLVEERGGVH